MIVLSCAQNSETRHLDKTINVYEAIAESTGYMQKIEENDRMIDVLLDLRSELDFGIEDSWKNAKPTYKGCEPLITSRNSVHC